METAENGIPPPIFREKWMAPTSFLHIGINARLFPANWRPLRREIDFARQAGFRAIQVRGKDEGLEEKDLGDPLPLLAEALQEASLALVVELLIHLDAGGRTAGGITPLDVLQANLPAIRSLGCRYVHWHLALATPLDPPAVRRLEEAVVPHLAEGVTSGRQEGFAFALENNEPDEKLFAQPDACKSVLDAVPGLGFVWDINHTPPEHYCSYEALLPRATVLHVADTPWPETNHHLPLGQGTINWPRVARSITRAGFQGPAILEIGGMHKSGGFGRDTDEALQDSLRRLASAVAKEHPLQLREHSVHLQGERACLRPLTEQDWDLLCRWNQDPEILYYAEGDDVASYSRQEVQSIYRSVSQKAFCFIVEVGGRPIGECWLQEMNLEHILRQYPGADCCRIDLMIGEKAYWGQGLGAEVIRLLTEMAFTQEHADWVFGCDIADYNPASLRAFLKNGYEIAERIEQVQGEKAGFRCNVRKRNPSILGRDVLFMEKEDP